MGWKIGIVGAGFSGLITARELERLGHEVEIFEARDRLGGRTWTTTDNSLGYPLEMGGTWVHWMQPYIWAEMQRYEAEMIVSPFVDKAYWFVNNEVRTGTEEELDGKLGEIQAKIFEGSREFFPFPHDPDYILRDPGTPEDVKERYRKADQTPVLAGLDGFSDEERALADSYWRAGYQGSSEKASSLMAKHWAALSDHRLGLLDDQTLRYKLKDGMKGIYDKIAVDVRGPIHLSTPIDAVNHNDDGATLTFADGTTREFDAVVVTIPAGALGNVEFSPGLPSAVQEVVNTK
ncbi:MAG: flavin monoamine oxidase family protein [Flaviflexus sp.]|uniref:flavin monoamine oxidase family protein n=1 Tax=Flaviflexus sp. TaxID=1969482 RepID=UPI003F904AA8